jgi:hypothetical protein
MKYGKIKRYGFGICFAAVCLGINMTDNLKAAGNYDEEEWNGGVSNFAQYYPIVMDFLTKTNYIKCTFRQWDEALEHIAPNLELLRKPEHQKDVHYACNAVYRVFCHIEYFPELCKEHDEDLEFRARLLTLISFTPDILADQQTFGDCKEEIRDFNKFLKEASTRNKETPLITPDDLGTIRKVRERISIAFSEN